MPKIDIYITERFPFYAFDEPEEDTPIGGVFDVSEETLDRLRAGMREFDYVQEVLRYLARGIKNV